ncbi:MAG TPA: glycosyltransferase [Lacunisphaera sp.]|nr:glycosyltransferase [Lacunisphaera sp.]
MTMPPAKWSTPDGIREDLDLTLFIPCLNEEKRVVPTIETARAALQDLPFSYEILVTDDGSRDRTSAVVEEYVRAHPGLDLRLHRNPANLGLARSFVDASFRGRGRYLRLICGDNVEPKESMAAILRQLGTADIIVPYYPVVPGKSRFRLFISGLYTRCVNLLSGHRLHYYNGHPLYRRYDVMRWASYNYGFGFQADLLTTLLDEGATFQEIALAAVHQDKGPGTSSVNLRNFLSVGSSLLEMGSRRLRRVFYPPVIAAGPPPPGRPAPPPPNPTPPLPMENASTREPQYQPSLDLVKDGGPASLGLMTNQAWHDDPRHLVFTLSRYKFVAKMLADRGHVLEVGCGDAFGTRIVAQTVRQLTATDFDPVFVADVNRRMDPKWRFACQQHDMLAGPFPGQYDAAYALDVIEHIPSRDENAFVGNIVQSLTPEGVLILGCPSLQSQVYASPPSKAGHVNCQTGDTMRALLGRFFHNVFIFSMNDEVVHTGYTPMAHYLIGLACTRRRA